MSRYYRGAGVGTYWHPRDARAWGFSAAMPGSTPGPYTIINHVTHQRTLSSPYISLTRSYEVAEHYARFYGTGYPSPTNPAYVYEIVYDPVPPGVIIIDPVLDLVSILSSPFSSTFYQHNGAPDVLLGLVDRGLFGHVLTRPVKAPGSSLSPGAGPNISDQLATLVRVLRDAEVLAYSSIPQNCVRNRFTVL